MSRAPLAATILILVLGTGSAANAATAVAPVSSAAWFDPTGIALAFTRTNEVVEPDDAWDGPAYAPFRFQPTSEGDLVMRLIPGGKVQVEVVREDVLRWSSIAVAPELLPSHIRAEVATIAPTHTILHATGFRAEESLLPTLTRIRRRLFFSVGAYSQSKENDNGADARWDGLADDDVETQGRTLDRGAVRGDLSVNVGTVGTDTSILQVLTGQAGILALNPFRDVSAQFDLAILGDKGPGGWNNRDLRVFVLRVRAAYLGAFNSLNPNGTTSTDSELGVAFGVKW